MDWETVAQIIAIIAAVAAAGISPILIVIFSNIMNKRIDDLREDIRSDIKDLRSIMQIEHEKLYSTVNALTETVYSIDKRLAVLETKQNNL